MSRRVTSSKVHLSKSLTSVVAMLQRRRNDTGHKYIGREKREKGRRAGDLATNCFFRFFD